MLERAQVSFTFSALLGQDMISEGLSVFVAAFAGFFKPLGRATTCLKFGHFHTPHSKLSLMVSPLQTNNGTARGKKETAKAITPCSRSLDFAQDRDTVKCLLAG